jgi:hypothetical protein
LLNWRLNITIIFDTNLSSVQQYLSKRLKIEPISKVNVDYNESSSKVIGITKVEEDTCTPPPFSILYFDIRHNSDNNRQIRAWYQGEHDVSFEGEEETILTKLYEYFVRW